VFLRSRKVRGKLCWSVVRERRIGGKVRRATIETLGPHPDRESAQKAWDALRGPFFGPDGLNDHAGFRSFADREPAPHRSIPGCFAVLGLDPAATEDEIKAAYRSKAVEVHPDRGGSHGAMVELNRAYEEATALAAARKGRPA
jgi:hypothetical protein